VKRVILFALSLLFIGCAGYSPSSKYISKELNKNIYTEVKIKLKDPENSVIIKDSIKEMAIKKFGAKIVSKEKSDSRVYIDLESVSFSNLQYDNNGYVILKRANVVMKSDYESDNMICSNSKRCTKKSTIKTYGTYDFSTTSDTLTDQERFIAIKDASAKALDELVSKLALKGVLSK
jgi:hypothetical protein